MNLDQLNKQQVILLALLVSIVTSIATGITIISLIGQSPVQTVNQTVNRVVEKTIERVVEKNDEETGEVIVPEKEVVTVVVNEEDLTIEAIENNSRSVARVFDSRNGDLISIGVIIKEDGTIYIPNTEYNRRAEYVGEFDSGSFNLSLIQEDDINNFLIMRPETSEEETSFSIIDVAQDVLKLGQTVISLSGINDNSVSTGIVTSLKPIEGQEGLSIINTSVKTDGIVKGAILLNLNGKIVGIRTGQESVLSTFSPSNIIPTDI